MSVLPGDSRSSALAVAVPPAGGPPTGDRRRLVRGALSAALLVGILAGAVPQLRGFGEAWALVRGLGAPELVLLAVVAAWNIASYWPAAVAALPGLSLPRAAMVNQAATAVASTIPGGDAISVGLMGAMYGSYGFTPSAITLAVLSGGICSTIAKLVVPLPAVAALAARGEPTAHLLPAVLAGVLAVAGGALVLLVARHPGLAGTVGDGAGRLVSRLRGLLGRPPVRGWGAALTAFRADAVVLVRRRGWVMVAFAVISHLSLFAVLLVALRIVGVTSADVSWAEALGAFALVHLLTTLPLPAGGLGVMELGLTTTLAAAGAADGQALAATLLFRAVTYLPPLPLGALAYVRWRRGAPARATMAGPPRRPAGPRGAPE